MQPMSFRVTIVSTVVTVCVLLSIPSILIADGSNGDNSVAEPYIEILDEDHYVVDSKRFADIIESTSTVRTKDGEVLRIEFGLKPEHIPYHLIMKNAAGSFNYTISMDLSQTIYKEGGVIIHIGNYSATLVPANNYKAALVDESGLAALLPEEEYPITFYTVGGTHVPIDIESLSGASITLLWRTSGDACFICFSSDGEFIDSRYILPGEPIGEIPEHGKHKGDFFGWYDPFDNEISSDTTYKSCNDLIMIQKWRTGLGSEVFIITTLLAVITYISLYLIFTRPHTK